ncbi:MAG: CBS domain-containing protein [Phycisphaerae bacterium]|jgi:CBS domain-containing protein
MATVRDILEKKGTRVHSVSVDATVHEAASLMNDHRIGGLVVTAGDKVVGIFTERDILCRVVAARRDPMSIHVRDVMTAPVACCTPATTWAECRAVMRQRRIRHLPVVEGERLHGIVSIGDILEVTEAEHQQTIRYLHEYLYGDWGGGR